MNEKRFSPELGEKYWFVTSDGSSCIDVYNLGLDEGRFNFGNCFKTEAEAQAAAEKFKALLLSLHGDGENLQYTSQNKKLPKLTEEVFDRIDCPLWAQYAAVCADGSVRVFRDKPSCQFRMYWYDPTGYLENGLKGDKFDATDWQNSLIARPVKALPDWCKVGEWVYSEDSRFKYSKITQVYENSINTNVNGAYTHSYILNGGVKPARLRPYNAEEIPDLPFEVTVRNSNFRTTVVSCDGDKVWLACESTAISTEDLKRGFTAKGNPCGILEHLENGEWVK